jgi:hypothetical protein
MKLVKVLGLMAGVGLLVCSVQAKATPFSYSDQITLQNPILLSSSNTPYTYQHNMLPHGFDPANDIISSAALDLYVRDNMDNPLGSPQDPPTDPFRLFLDGSYFGSYEVNFQDLVLDITADESTIQNDGKLNVTINIVSSTSNFYLGGSTLQISGDTRVAAAPEPGVVFLMGIGLLMLVAVTRARFPRRRVPSA